MLSALATMQAAESTRAIAWCEHKHRQRGQADPIDECAARGVGKAACPGGPPGRVLAKARGESVAQE